MGNATENRALSFKKPRVLETTVVCFGEKHRLTLTQNGYGNGDLAIVASCDGERWGVMTVCVPDYKIGADEIIVKTYSENEHWVPQVLENLKEHFEPRGRTVRTGWVECPVYRVKNWSAA